MHGYGAARVTLAREFGASYLIPSFGVTLRDRQRKYSYAKLDQHFPGLRKEYDQRFGNQYFAPARNLPQLEAIVRSLCQEVGLQTAIPQFTPQKNEQLRLF